jgi:hypothetical protein
MSEKKINWNIPGTGGCFKIKEVRAGGQEIYNALMKRITLDFDSIPGSRFISEKWDKGSLNISLETPLRLKYNHRFQKQITFQMIVGSRGSGKIRFCVKELAEKTNEIYINGGEKVTLPTEKIPEIFRA